MGLDYETIKPTEEDYEKVKEIKELVDPLVEDLMYLEEENLIAFRLAKYGLDNVYNIGANWTYDMVMEAIHYQDTVGKIEERENKKAQAKNK